MICSPLAIPPGESFDRSEQPDYFSIRSLSQSCQDAGYATQCRQVEPIPAGWSLEYRFAEAGECTGASSCVDCSIDTPGDCTALSEAGVELPVGDGTCVTVGEQMQVAATGRLVIQDPHPPEGYVATIE